MENSNNTGKIVTALLLGAAVGSVLGVLFAPDKGSETRRKIAAKGEDLSNAFRDQFDEFLDEVKQEASLFKDKADEILENLSLKSENT